MKTNFSVALNVLFLRKIKMSEVKLENGANEPDVCSKDIKIEPRDLEVNKEIYNFTTYVPFWCTIPLNNLVESATNCLK